MNFVAKTLIASCFVGLVSYVSAQEQPLPLRVPLIKMPGASFSGPLPPLTQGESRLARTLREDAEYLADKIGERNVYKHDRLVKAALFLEKSLAKTGYKDKIERQKYTVRGRQCWNIIVEIPGTTRAKEIVVVGGHYDSAPGAPGANDNGSGTVATLALARSFAGKQPKRTIRFVFFVNEEPPHFQTEAMGSLVYARRCKKRKEDIVAMLSLETLGYYSDQKGSQKYPAPLNLFFPTTGNFIGFVGNTKSAPLVQQVTRSFRKHAKFPSEGTAMPGRLTGIDWSDHWSFWQVGYPALMVTDTALFRYPHYHRSTDTSDKLDYGRMARVIVGLERVISELIVLK